MRRPCCMDADFGGLSVFSGLAPYVREADDQDFGQEGLSKAFFLRSQRPERWVEILLRIRGGKRVRKII